MRITKQILFISAMLGAIWKIFRVDDQWINLRFFINNSNEFSIVRVELQRILRRFFVVDLTNDFPFWASEH